MKNLKLIISIMLFLFATVYTIIACNDNIGIQEMPNRTNNESKTANTARTLPVEDTLSIKIEENSYRILLTGTLVGNEVNSKLKVFLYNNLIFEVPYDFNISEEHWRLKQSPKIINQATILKNIQPSIIVDVQKIFDKSVDYIYAETLDSKNRNLVSLVNFHNAILNTTIRSNNENSDCNCTVHPGFIIDKTFFNCQEDQFYNVAELSSALSDYAINNELDTSTSTLITYLQNTNDTNIRFDDYYNFYFPKEEFQNSISDFLQNTSKKRCWLGLGSGHHCCGNYSGCCYYVNPICYVHDTMCSDCKPSWFCLPGCKPDKNINNNNTITIT